MFKLDFSQLIHQHSRIRRGCPVSRIRRPAAASGAGDATTCRRRSSAVCWSRWRCWCRGRAAWICLVRHPAAGPVHDRVLHDRRIRREPVAAEGRRSAGRCIFLLLVRRCSPSLQNVVGVLIALPMGMHPLFGVLNGSVTLTGGPATGLAFAPAFEAGRRPGRRDRRDCGGDGRHRLRRIDWRAGRDDPDRAPQPAAPHGATRTTTRRSRRRSSRMQMHEPPRPRAARRGQGVRTRCSRRWS